MNLMSRVLVVMLLAATVAAGCAKKKPAPATQPAPPPAATTTTPPPAPPPPRPAQRVEESQVAPLPEDAIGNRSLEDLNRDSPFKPAFFALDSADLDDAGRAIVNANAEIMKRYPTWVVTIEGHCDERGTAEYNLALGERRAVTARAYLVSLGVSADRLRIVSYGKEFPFDPGHEETSFSKNRRAHFVITAK